MKTQIQFYSGLDTVGGVVMEIRYGNDRILLEMGSAYNPAFDLYDGSVDIRNHYISDGIWTNDIPQIDGIFNAKDIQSTSLQSVEDSNLHTVVLLTHLHLDHMRNMGCVSDKVDVYLCKNAQIIEQALQDIGEGVYSVRTHYRDIGDSLTFGQIHVTPIIINDASYKDYSYFIETPDLKLHYTGDVFVYGVYQKGIEKELEFLKQQDVDILVCEGTGFLPGWLAKLPESQYTPRLHDIEGVISEQEMLKSTQERINSYDGLILFNIYNREISHIQNWLDFASRSNRTIVFEPKTAYILNGFTKQSYNVLIPDTYENQHYPEYLKKVIENNALISKNEILSHPEQFLVQNSYENILECFDYRHIKAMYMHHSGTPLGDYDPAYEKMMTILNRSNIEYCYLYKNEHGEFFSHAVANQLLWYIEQVRAKLLVPSHCPNRQLEAQCAGQDYYLCQLNKKYYYDRQRNTLVEEEE